MFNFLVNAFNIVLYWPLFNALIWIYNHIPGQDFGIAIILLTILIRVILYPISVKALRSQKALQRLQPQMQEIQKKYKDDKEKQARETLELYKKENINPFSGLFLALVQLPILIALYKVFWSGLNKEELIHLYSFVAVPLQINASFLSLVDLSKPNITLAIIAGLLQFFQTKMLLPSKKEDKGKQADMTIKMQKQMVYFLPIITIVILFKLPSALGLYWTMSGLFSIVQQYFALKEKQQNTL